MRFVGPTRREIGIRTVFNILGPLTNPAGARHQLIGVGHPGIATKLASALASLGSGTQCWCMPKRGSGRAGVGGAITGHEYDARQGEVVTYAIAPEDVGLHRAESGALAGGDVQENVRITLGILNGETGARRDAVLFNAGAGIYAANSAASIAEGIAIAQNAIDSGRALEAMERLVALTTQLVAEKQAEAGAGVSHVATGTILDKILDQTAKDVAVRKSRTSPETLRARRRPPGASQPEPRALGAGDVGDRRNQTRPSPSRVGSPGDGRPGGRGRRLRCGRGGGDLRAYR